MSIIFVAGDKLVVNTSFVNTTLSVQPSPPLLNQALGTLGTLAGQIFTVINTGIVPGPLQFINVVPLNTNNPAFNGGAGVNIFFATETLLNNSFELSTAFLPDTIYISVLNN